MVSPSTKGTLGVHWKPSQSRRHRIYRSHADDLQVAREECSWHAGQPFGGVQLRAQGAADAQDSVMTGETCIHAVDVRKSRRVPRPLRRSVRWRTRNSPGLSDRKSTRLNSSHGYISYAVFCLKKKKNKRALVRHLCFFFFF